MIYFVSHHGTSGKMNACRALIFFFLFFSRVCHVDLCCSHRQWLSCVCLQRWQFMKYKFNIIDENFIHLRYECSVSKKIETSFFFTSSLWAGSSSRWWFQKIISLWVIKFVGRCQEIPVCRWGLELLVCFLTLWLLDELGLFIHPSLLQKYFCLPWIWTDVIILSTIPMRGNASQHPRFIWMFLKSETI